MKTAKFCREGRTLTGARPLGARFPARSSQGTWRYLMQGVLMKARPLFLGKKSFVWNNLLGEKNGIQNGNFYR